MKFEEKTHDPLLQFLALPLERIFYPYGFPLLVRTNDARVIDSAVISFGGFQQEAAVEPVLIEIAITGEDTGPFPEAPVIRARRHLLWFVSDAVHHAICDFQTGEGVAWLTPRVFSDMARFRFHFLEALGFGIVVERHLAGIHAACLTRNNRGVLLWGLSGAGKSTLAYALARRGWTYVSDDGSFLVRADTDSVAVGNPHRIRFRPSAAALFPELDGLLAVEDPNGKMTIEVSTSALQLSAIASRAQVHYVVILNRTASGDAALQRYPVAEALARLTSHCYGTDAVKSEKSKSMRRLLSGGVFQLTYSTLEGAIRCLEELPENAPA